MFRDSGLMSFIMFLRIINIPYFLSNKLPWEPDSFLVKNFSKFSN